MEDQSHDYSSCAAEQFSVDCPHRVLFGELSDKWSMMVLTVLANGPTRFNALKRRLEGISQKSLSQTLRKLERNGIITREVVDTAPVAVQYDLSPLGHSVLPPFRALYQWTKENLDQVEAARSSYDTRAG
ncbi:helix-turn-helix domain-containing protein [Pseudooceanicola sp. HF7]|uniref:winged helix-turn-helix transcriptional regulator n=1 Tax=Pseudooceanicola sp. HF7 TaxID=2721560 RepID=UPI00143025BA|nr:helix-turn-helix domain-containing protein [Pseudooceanicola sp. HF7]NIZ08645.1 helix-turn-helix transcriptional regulator [Pseudooceanicola sp. HF7]